MRKGAGGCVADFAIRRSCPCCRILHLNIAYASLGEALDQIDDGLESEYFTEKPHEEMIRICKRAMKANIARRRPWKREAP